MFRAVGSSYDAVSDADGAQGAGSWALVSFTGNLTDRMVSLVVVRPTTGAHATSLAGFS